MKDCDDYTASIRVYLDKRLSAGDLEDFRSHLEECEACRLELEAEERLSALLHRARPLYVASDALRKRVMSAVELSDSSAGSAIIHQRQNAMTVGARQGQSARHRTRNWVAWIAAVFLVSASFMLVRGNLKRTSANSYIEAAIGAHRGFVDGSLPLEIQTNSPSVVSAWFASRVPFNFRLPSSQERSHHAQIFELTGGRLVNYKGESVALVGYRMRQVKVSLLVSSSGSVAAAGGEEVPSGGIVFHYRRHGSFNVITWSTHGLTYALVSSLPGSGWQSCLVCHQDLGDGAHL